jgi:hypothetical protein
LPVSATAVKYSMSRSSGLIGAAYLQGGDWSWTRRRRWPTLSTDHDHGRRT